MKSDPVPDSVAVQEPVQAQFSGVTADPQLEKEAIARLAYSFWEARGREHGHAEEDWIRAEMEYRRSKAGL